MPAPLRRADAAEVRGAAAPLGVPRAGTAGPAAANPSPKASAAGAPAPAPHRDDPSWSRARAIVAEAMKVPTSYARLQSLTDTVGCRLAGSAAEPKAVAWAKAQFEKDGLRVDLEPVKVPVWVRGKESVEILEPIARPLVVLGLGGTVGTPPEGVTAPVVVVESLDELKAMDASKVSGRIVLYDNPFVRTGDEMTDYGNAVKCRGDGASEAARKGAVGALVRSVATASLRTPHTGGLKYADDVPKIPAAAVTIEDAMLIHRIVRSGSEVRVRMQLDDRKDPDRDGANVVTQIRGRTDPEEIVLIGAHLDSWDVGMGAIDDGAGCAMVLETMRLIASGPPPRRTVRAVLYANEENGGRGAKGYAEKHAAELARHVAAIESDSGGGRALGFSLGAGEGGLDVLRDLFTPVLAPIGATRLRAGEGGADIGELKTGVPLLGLEPDTTHYFDWHHTMADTLDKIDPQELQHATAAMAAATWILAETPVLLPRVPPKAEDEKKSK